MNQNQKNQMCVRYRFIRVARYTRMSMIAHYYLVDSHLAFIEPVILTVGMTEPADAHQLIQLAWCHPKAPDTKYVLSRPFATHLDAKGTQ